MTSPQRSYIMSRIRSRNTSPERAVRHALWNKGYRYRLNDKRLPGSPDLVLPKYRTVIFINGCFWHGHKNCKNASIPKSNYYFWKDKLSRNLQRDQEVWRLLEAQGWHVIIVWECQLKKALLDETIIRIEAEILCNGEVFRSIQNDRKKAREEYMRKMKAKKERKIAFNAELQQE